MNFDIPSLKSVALTLTFGLFLIQASAQKFDFPVESTDKVVEGKVVESSGTWNSDQSFIYTIHKIKINRIFQGSYTGKYIHILTSGGNVGETILHSSHPNPVNENSRGLFFLKSTENTLPDSLRHLKLYRLVNYDKGFAQYYDDGINPPAIYNGKVVYNREFDLSLQLQDKTGQCIQVENKVNAPRQNGSGLPVVIYSIGNVKTTGQYNDTVEFDVFARIEQEPGESQEDETAFANAELYFDYDSTVFGSNLVQSGNIEVSKGEIIQNSSYSLSLEDSTPSKAKVDIDYSGGADQVTWVGSDPMQLFEVKAQIISPTIHSTILFDEPSMEEQSQYYDTVSNTFETYYNVETEGRADVSMYPAGDVGITYGIDNQRLVGGNPPDSIRFDITAYANKTGTKLENADIYLRYNPQAFGYKIKAGSNFSYELGAVFDSAKYDEHSPQFYDINDSTLNILIYKYQQGTGNSGYVSIPTQPINLITLTFAIDDCEYKNNFSFVESEMIGNQTYVGGDSNKFLYKPVVATDIDSNVTCSDSLPIITSFKPKHGYGAIPAGVKDTLIVNGLNFTDSGSVWFRNADTLDIYGRAYESDIMSWTDTVIELILPGTLYPSKGPPGTGLFMVKNSNGDTAISPEEIDIPFCAGTVRGIEYGVRFYLADLNSQGGLDLFVDSSFQNINNGITSIQWALDKWRCSTKLNFVLRDSLVDVDPFALLDGVSTISFVPPSQMQNPNKLAETYSVISDRTSICPGPGTVIRQVLEVDILVRNTVNWYSDTLTSIGHNQMDLISVLTHEFGHAHLLKHALKENKQMFYGIPPDTIKRGLHQDDIFGGRTILEDGRKIHFPQCEYEPMQDSTFPFCLVPNSIADESSQTNNLLVYPNPAYNKVNIDVDTHHNFTDGRIKIYDYKGRTVLNSLLHSSQKSLDISELTSGLYIVRILYQDSGKQFSTKLVIH